MDKTKKKHVKDYSFLIGIISLIIVLGLWFINYNYGLSLNPESENTRGVFGDMFGAVNAIFSGLAFAGIILSLYMQRIELRIQRKELKLTRKEVKRTNKEFKLQNQTMELQKFENTFFNMLSIHHQIVDGIDFEPLKLIENEDEITKLLSHDHTGVESIIAEFEKSRNLTGRDVFKFSLVFLYSFIERDLLLNNFKDDIDVQIVNLKNYNQYFNSIPIFYESVIYLNGMTLNTKFNSIYNFTYGKFSADFGHYFRNLYRLIKMVDERQFDENIVKDYKIKYSYTSIIRAQLSDDEIKWLFFNCIFHTGFKKFKPLLEKYTLLKLIYRDDFVFKF